MSERDVQGEVLAELRKVALRELEYSGPLEPAHSLRGDLKLDSMGLIIFAVALENRFRVKLQEEDAEALETVGDLIALVERRLKEAA